MERNRYMQKFKIGFLGGDSHAGTINDMFQDSLPYHPMVESVDWEWTSARLGKHVLDAVGKQYILDNIKKYDLIFINPWELNENNNPGLEILLDKLNLWGKVILYDIHDDSTMHHEKYRKKCLLYLKRAWDPNIIPADQNNLIPLDFPLFKWYLEVVPMDFYYFRDMTVTCTLPQISKHLPRGLVVHTVKNTEWEAYKDNWITQLTLFYSSGWVLSSAATAYREELTPLPPNINWWYVYIHMLRRTRVIFNAANHSAIGDHRTWEQFASGALVVTDKIAVPSPHLPEPWIHYIPFDLKEPNNTIKVVKELLRDDTERNKIARAGLEHAIKYHHSDTRISYVIEEVTKRMVLK